MFRANRKDFPTEEFLSRVAEGSGTGVLREGPYEVHLKGGRVVGTFYLGFPTPPVWVAAALLSPGEGEYAFTPEAPLEGGKALLLASFLLEGALALEEAKSLAHPSLLVFVPGRAFSGPPSLSHFLPLASLVPLLPSFEAGAILSESGSFVLERKGRVLVLRGAS